MITTDLKKERDVPRIFDIGDSVQLLTLEKLPARHFADDFHLSGIQNNPQKISHLGKQCTIADYFFYKNMGEWVYRIKEDGRQWVWLKDMFLFEQVLPKEKGQGSPQMPII